MKKSILNLGEVLSKVAQKSINGGSMKQDPCNVSLCEKDGGYCNHKDQCVGTRFYIS
ncbi:hypothetical protein [Aquimarina longa]|uniref:hypothetical protein n=1 Tax=Aquimarina longa TaxID=1080221 RepID=UPI000A7B5586|nr:hypothetical protein [Aquimarina longa]